MLQHRFLLTPSIKSLLLFGRIQNYMKDKGGESPYRKTDQIFLSLINR